MTLSKYLAEKVETMPTLSAENFHKAIAAFCKNSRKEIQIYERDGVNSRSLTEDYAQGRYRQY